VVIPAFNEERYIGRTLEHLQAAANVLASRTDSVAEILVVDNDSTDRTAALARERGARVVRESEHNIGKVRNTGARMTRHDVLVFVDADTLVPRELLLRIAQQMRDPRCAGGAVDVRLHPKRFAVRAYLEMCRGIAAIGRVAMGACQFCRRDAFMAAGGYDETVYVGEDVEFGWRLHSAALRHGLTTCMVRDLHVTTSSRRFDSWPLWRVLLLTNPFIIMALCRRKSAWRAWYDPTAAPR